MKTPWIWVRRLHAALGFLELELWIALLCACREHEKARLLMFEGNFKLGGRGLLGGKQIANARLRRAPQRLRA